MLMAAKIFLKMLLCVLIPAGFVVVFAFYAPHNKSLQFFFMCITSILIGWYGTKLMIKIMKPYD